MKQGALIDQCNPTCRQATSVCRYESQKSPTVFTIGYGHIWKAGEPTLLSKDAANTLMATDIARDEMMVVQSVVDRNLTQTELDALTDWCYSAGCEDGWGMIALQAVNAQPQECHTDECALALWNAMIESGKSNSFDTDEGKSLQQCACTSQPA